MMMMMMMMAPGLVGARHQLASELLEGLLEVCDPGSAISCLPALRTICTEAADQPCCREVLAKPATSVDLAQCLQGCHTLLCQSHLAVAKDALA